jgi:mannose-6-phosphate isomerase
MSLDNRIFKLKGIVQYYSWGGYEFIPQLLNLNNKEHQPFAEYWMGAHGNHPATVENEKEEGLNEFIDRDADAILGKIVAEKFSALPYLFKVLDVRQMLSIQVHPSKEVAEKSFEEESKKGIPVNAPNRNYKDKNHKPELMVALGDFYLLHGFKPTEELEKILEEKEAFRFLKTSFLKGGYKALYEEVMQMDQMKVNVILQPLMKKILPLYESGALQKDNEDFWAARAALSFCRNDDYDRGIFSIYFFNLVHLKKGEGIFQPSGLPHAYLEGQNVEIMANSDNVLRAGLTDKHVDVPELMKHVKFEATIPNVLTAHSKHTIYSSPAKEFELQHYVLNPDEEVKIETATAEIFLVMEGKVRVKSGNREQVFNRGEPFFAIAATEFGIRALEQTSLFRVTVP